MAVRPPTIAINSAAPRNWILEAGESTRPILRSRLATAESIKTPEVPVS